MPFKPRPANANDTAEPAASDVTSTSIASGESVTPPPAATPTPTGTNNGLATPTEASGSNQPLKPFRAPVLVTEANQGTNSSQENGGDAAKPSQGTETSSTASSTAASSNTTDTQPQLKRFVPPRRGSETSAAPVDPPNPSPESSAAASGVSGSSSEAEAQQSQVKRFAPPRLVSEPSNNATNSDPSGASASADDQPKLKPFAPRRMSNSNMDASAVTSASGAASEVQPQIRPFEPPRAASLAANQTPPAANPEPSIRAFSPPKLGLGATATTNTPSTASGPTPSGAFIRPFAPPKAANAAPAAPVDNRDETAKLLERFSAQYSSEDVLLDCDMCEKARSALHCISCAASFCGPCDLKIHALKNKCDHVRSDIKRASPNGESHCPFHKSKVLDQYCKKCDTIVCMACRDVGLHRGHRVEPLSVLLAEKREALDAKVDLLAQSMRHVESVLVKVTGHMGRLAPGPNGAPSEAEAAAIAEVEATFGEITKQVNERRAKLLSEVDDLAALKLGTIQSQLASVQDTIQKGTSLTEICDLVDDPNVSFTPEALAVILKSASSFVEQSKTKDWEFPITSSFIGVSFSDAMKTRIASFGSVGGPDNLQFFVDNKTGQCTVRWSPPVSKRPGVSLMCYNCDAVVVKPNFDGSSKVTIVSQGDVFPDGVNDLKFVVNVRTFAGAKLGFRVRAVYSDKSMSDWCVTDEPVTLAQRYLEKTCEMKTHFDKNGVLYHIGCRGGKKVHSNPHNDGEVMVAWSSIGDGSVDLFVSHEYNGAFSYTSNAANSWMSVDLGRQRAVTLRGYCLRHDAMGPRGALRNWVLQGRNDPPQRVGFSITLAPPSEADWVTLSEHKDDNSLRAEAGSTAYFAIEPSAKTNVPYRYFRLLQTGPNSSGRLRLSCAGIELYGDLS